MNENERISKLRTVAYKTDASMIEAKPQQVFLAENTGEIVNKVVFNNDVVVRGGGSGLAGVDSNNSLIIDLSKLNKILEFNKDKKQILVEAGIVLAELNEFLEKYNLEFPIKPLSAKIATIGGMIACNASGFRELKYGKTGNWVDEVELINGKGEILKLGKADLSDVIGEEGITGIITKARLKIVEKPVRAASLYELENIENVIDIVKKLRLVENISMIFFLDKFSSSVLGLNDKYHVIAEFESEAGSVRGDYGKLMEIIEKVYPSLAILGYAYLEDFKIFLDKFSELANFLEESKVPYFADLGSGVVHPCFQDKRLINQLLAQVRRFHGKVAGKFGYGVKKKQYFDNMEKKLITRIKLRYDPKFKINKNVIIESELEELNKEKEDEMKIVRFKKDKEIEERAEENIEETEKKLDEEMQHDEKIGESEIEDDLYKAEE